MTILHIAHASDWAAALDTGEYRVSTRDASLEEVGFIHASRGQQVSVVATFVYPDDPEELVVLTIDETGLDVRDEDGGDGELFPHVYGPIPVASVTTVSPAHFDDGIFTF
jgi:uncharacterized protein (DUF952 family)